ncbi:hypothetical protein CEP52_013826 [Fusarium oligoseptatum]|uniref:Uncharacterized protein n=1 Tax=Fusarium oligoseptatum TaxID=2604345 RepID=A0A428SRI5_9HYPO|nr:hypothetical protein CEP52_013826 [Fusarium oligoseptatum]
MHISHNCLELIFSDIFLTSTLLISKNRSASIFLFLSRVPVIMSDQPHQSNRLTPEDMARMRQSAAADPAYRPGSRPQSAAAGCHRQHPEEPHARRPASQGSSQPQGQPPGRPSSEPTGHRQTPSNGPFQPPLEPIADNSPRMPPPPGGFRRAPQGPSTRPPEHGPSRPTSGVERTPDRHNEHSHSQPYHLGSDGRYTQPRPQPKGEAPHGDGHRHQTPAGNPMSDDGHHEKPRPPKHQSSDGRSSEPGTGARNEHQHPKHGDGHAPRRHGDQEEPPPRSHPGSHSRRGYQPPPNRQPPPPYSEDSDSQEKFKTHNTRRQTDDSRRFQPPPHYVANGTPGTPLHPDSLKWFWIMLITVAVTVLVYFLVVKWSLFEIGDTVSSWVSGIWGAICETPMGLWGGIRQVISETWRGMGTGLSDVYGICTNVTTTIGEKLSGPTHFVSGAWGSITGWALAKFASESQQPTGSAVIDVTPLSPLIDAWCPAIQVVQHMAYQADTLFKSTERNMVQDQKIKEVRQRNEEYTKELTSTLANDHLWIDFLVRDIEKNPLSELCWPNPSNRSINLWVTSGFYNSFQTGKCRRKLVAQLTTLSKALQCAHDSRSKLLIKVQALLEKDLGRIRQAVCGQRDEYRAVYSERHKDMKPGASDRNAVGSYLDTAAELLGVGDATCRMIEADYAVMAAKVKIMDDEVKFLNVFLAWLATMIEQWETKANDAASQMVAVDVEKMVLERGKRWLNMAEKYSEEM